MMNIILTNFSELLDSIIIDSLMVSHEFTTSLHEEFPSRIEVPTSQRAVAQLHLIGWFEDANEWKRRLFQIFFHCFSVVPCFFSFFASTVFPSLGPACRGLEMFLPRVLHPKAVLADRGNARCVKMVSDFMGLEIGVPYFQTFKKHQRLKDHCNWVPFWQWPTLVAPRQSLATQWVALSTVLKKWL